MTTISGRPRPNKPLRTTKSPLLPLLCFVLMMVLLLFLLAKAVFFIFVALTTTVEDRLLEFKEEADARRAEDEDKDAKDNII